MSNCPCCSGQPYESCCEPYLAGRADPETAEQLMRARYTAHVRADMDYVTATHHPETLDTFDARTAEKWAKESEWLGLEILSTSGGGPDDDHGIVEFVCSYRDRTGERHDHPEVSLFDRVDGNWRFRDAEPPPQTQVRRDTPKVGRNDPCPCGSGKKYKKCCA